MEVIEKDRKGKTWEKIKNNLYNYQEKKEGEEMRYVVFYILFGMLISIFFMILFSVGRFPNPLQSQQEIKEEREHLIFKVTAYTNSEKCCTPYFDGITASGYKLRKGNKLCAATLPFCTVLKIPGYGIAPVLDRGGAIKEGCIDVYFDTEQEALEWGVKYLEVEILR